MHEISFRTAGGIPLRALFLVFCALLIVQCSGGQPSSYNSDGVDGLLAEPEGAALSYQNGETVYVTASKLRSRKKPSRSGRIVGRYRNGESLEIQKISGEWLKVSKRGHSGWISARYVTSQSPTSIHDRTSASAGRSDDDSDSGGGFSWFGKRCKRGKPCGNACISQSRTCHK